MVQMVYYCPLYLQTHLPLLPAWFRWYFIVLCIYRHIYHYFLHGPDGILLSFVFTDTFTITTCMVQMVYYCPLYLQTHLPLLPAWSRWYIIVLCIYRLIYHYYLHGPGGILLSFVFTDTSTITTCLVQVVFYCPLYLQTHLPLLPAWSRWYIIVLCIYRHIYHYYLLGPGGILLSFVFTDSSTITSCMVQMVYYCPLYLQTHLPLLPAWSRWYIIVLCIYRHIYHYFLHGPDGKILSFVFTDTSTITTCMVQVVYYCPLYLQTHLPLLPAWSRWYIIVLCIYRHIYHYYLLGPGGILLSFVFTDSSTITSCMFQMVYYCPLYLQTHLPLLPAWSRWYIIVLCIYRHIYHYFLHGPDGILLSFVFTDTSTITSCMVQMVKYCPLYLQTHLPLLPAWSRWYIIVLCIYRHIYHYYLHGPGGILLSFVFTDTSTITTCMVQVVYYCPLYLQTRLPLLPAWSRWYFIVLCIYRLIYHYFLHGPDGILLSFVFTDTSTITSCMVQMVYYCPLYLQTHLPLLPAWSRWYIIVLCIYRHIYHYFLHGQDGKILSFVFTDTSTITTCMV